ncbi:MAG: YihY/virulence factor BrkB family protein [Planctomycetota bacterium]|jgi:membrane protein
MNIVNQIKQRLWRLLTAPRDELTGWAKFGQTQLRWWWFSARQLHEKNVMAMSAALCFRTIFAMIPTLVLGTLMLTALGFQDEMRKLVHNGLREVGLSSIVYHAPSDETDAEGKGTFVTVDESDTQTVAVDAKVEEFMDRVEKQLTVGAMGPIGVAVLVWAAMTLLTTIERCMNRVFEAPRGRPLGRRILLYWSTITLAPLLMLLASFAAGRIGEFAEGIPVLGQWVESAGWLAAIIVVAVVLAFVYQLMPNTRVSFKAAMAGVAVALPLWLVARWAFALYVERAAFGSLYGVLGLFVLFLMWLNASWWIFLFGAQLAHTAGNLNRLAYAEHAQRQPIGPWDVLAALVAVVRVNAARSGPVAAENVAADLACGPERVDHLLDRLVTAGLICPVADPAEREFVPALPADQMKVADILTADCPYADQQQWPGDEHIARAVHQALGQSQAGIDTLTVADLIRS